MEFKYDISGCSSFQRKSVESLYNKFFEEKKSKLVLADEVGMGKTFVCKGLIENAKKIDKKYTVFYVSPNEIITKQNHGELCQGLVEKTTKAVRLSELDDDKINESKDYNIYSFDLLILIFHDYFLHLLLLQKIYLIVFLKHFVLELIDLHHIEV